MNKYRYTINILNFSQTGVSKKIGNCPILEKYCRLYE